MINIITGGKKGISLDLSAKVDGPQKVIDNLIKGLEVSGIEFSFNKFNFENTIALSGSAGISVPAHMKNKTIVGPQVWPYNNNYSGDEFLKVIAPSQWVADSFIRDTNIKKVLVWPVGIDTYIFNPTKEEKKYDCLIYFKRREGHELEHVTNLLKAKNQTYKILSYGSYKQSEFINLVRKCKYVFMIDGSESQGIAYLEMLSMGVPIFNWDIIDFPYLGEKYNIHCTSAPYWSDECGIKVYNKEDIDIEFDNFLDNINRFNPRNYILENLTLERQAKELINAFT